jgi:putative phage-type endonuclease
MTAPEPGSDEWRGLVTASKVGAILGLSPYASPYSTWRLMRGDVKPPEDSEEAKKRKKRGHLLEDGILDWWQSEHPEYPGGTRQFAATRPEYPWALATPDMVAWHRTCTDPHCEALGPECTERVIVEAKTDAHMDDWGKPGTDQVPASYLAQCYWQLATGSWR